jgi:hypothetical protein
LDVEEQRNDGDLDLFRLLGSVCQGHSRIRCAVSVSGAELVAREEPKLVAREETKLVAREETKLVAREEPKLVDIEKEVLGDEAFEEFAAALKEADGPGGHSPAWQVSGGG